MITTASIRDIMTKDLITVKPNNLITAVDRIFSANDFHHIPVIEDDGKLVGIISRYDFNLLCDKSTLFNNNALSINQRVFQSILAKDIMIKQLVTIGPDETPAKAADIMKENLFHALPVVDENKTLIGIVTTYDLLALAYH